jgi:hypothetical protein
VAEWHTYFVGEPGVWVHNKGGRPCDRLRGIFEKFQKPPHNLGPNEALVRTFERMPASVFGQPMLGAVEDASRLAFGNAAAAGGNPMLFVRTVDWWKAVMTGRKGKAFRARKDWTLYSGSYFEIHHIVPKELRRAFGITLEEGAIPGLPISWFQHDGGRFIGGFHSILREELAARGLRDIPQGLFRPDQRLAAIEAIREAYRRMKWSDGLSNMDDVGKVAENFIVTFS